MSEKTHVRDLPLYNKKLLPFLWKTEGQRRLRTPPPAQHHMEAYGASF